MGVIEVADFEEDEEMEAVGAIRRSEDGIVVAVRGSTGVFFVAMERGLPRSARGAADLRANMSDGRREEGRTGSDGSQRERRV